MDTRALGITPAMDRAVRLIELQAEVVQAARALLGAECGSLPYGLGANDLKRALAELDREFGQA